MKKLIKECFLISVNIEGKDGNKWNYFDEIKKISSRINTFRYMEGMEKGDIILLHVNNKNLDDDKKGIYAIGEMIEDRCFIQNDEADYNRNQKVVFVKINKFNYNEPIISKNKLNDYLGENFLSPQGLRKIKNNEFKIINDDLLSGKFDIEYSDIFDEV